MSDLERILWTSASTIIGGVILFVIGQLLSKLLIEPFQELNKAIAEVRFNLAYYRNTIHTPISRDKDRSDKAYDAITKSWCDLLTKANAVPRFLHCNRNIDRAAIDLCALATYLHQTGENAESHIEEVNRRVESIERQLQLRPLE